MLRPYLCIREAAGLMEPRIPNWNIIHGTGHLSSIQALAAGSIWVFLGLMIFILACLLIGGFALRNHRFARAIAYILGALAAAVLIVLYLAARFFPNDLQVRRPGDFVLGGSGKSIRVVFMADFHIGGDLGAGWLRRLIETAKAEKPLFM